MWKEENHLDVHQWGPPRRGNPSLNSLLVHFGWQGVTNTYLLPQLFCGLLQSQVSRHEGHDLVLLEREALLHALLPLPPLPVRLALHKAERGLAVAIPPAGGDLWTSMNESCSPYLQNPDGTTRVS